MLSTFLKIIKIKNDWPNDTGTLKIFKVFNYYFLVKEMTQKTYKIF